MTENDGAWQVTEHNGGRVQRLNDRPGLRLILPPVERSYANAQVDSYRTSRGVHFDWLPGSTLSVRARFSSEAQDLVGTAGFGFWNAPFGPGMGLRLQLPSAVWFFYASGASDLPLAPDGVAGNGWFVSTIDATHPRAVLWALLALPVLTLNQVHGLKRRIWPLVRRDLKMSFEPVSVSMRDWHDYRIAWRRDRTVFDVDGCPLLITPMSPTGPLGFVAWMDNQAMVAKPTGRVGWKTEAGPGQWLELSGMKLAPFAAADN